MLPKEHRLKREKDIKILFSKGKGVFGDVCGLKFKKNNLEVSRFVVVVGTKVSKKAVERNRIRRRIRAVLHRHLLRVAPGYDIAILARKDAVGASQDVLEGHVLRALKKAKLFIESP